MKHKLSDDQRAENSRRFVLYFSDIINGLIGQGRSKSLWCKIVIQSKCAFQTSKQKVSSVSPPCGEIRFLIFKGKKICPSFRCTIFWI